MQEAEPQKRLGWSPIASWHGVFPLEMFPSYKQTAIHFTSGLFQTCDKEPSGNKGQNFLSHSREIRRSCRNKKKLEVPHTPGTWSGNFFTMWDFFSGAMRPGWPIRVIDKVGVTGALKKDKGRSSVMVTVSGWAEELLHDILAKQQKVANLIGMAWIEIILQKLKMKRL